MPQRAKDAATPIFRPLQNKANEPTPLGAPAGGCMGE
jgi:hypothetical protein